MPCSFGHFCKALVVLTASALAASCSPIYSIGVRGSLSQPMSVDCILNAAQATEGVQHVLTHQNEPKKGGELIEAVDNVFDPPTAYLVTTINQVAQVEQRPLKDGQVSFWVGRQDVGITPSRHTIEVDQAFYVRLASHVAKVCNARYAGSAGLTCVPDSEACQKLIGSPRSK